MATTSSSHDIYKLLTNLENFQLLDRRTLSCKPTSHNLLTTQDFHRQYCELQEKKVEVPREASISTIAKATPLAPAVPSVLFQGVKIPKNPTPPTRIARERDEIPEIRHSGSHEFAPRE